MKRFFLFAAVISLVIATSCGTSATPTVSVTATPTASATNVSAGTSTPMATATTVGNATATVPLPTATATTVGNATATVPVTATVPLGLGVRFVHTATVANIISNYTLIDNPLTNNNPNAIVLVTPNWNPGGVGGTYDDHSIGVFYRETAHKWAIFNQDLANMPVDAAFNVLIPTSGTAAFVHTATVANIISNYTLIDNPLTNNNPNAIVLVTPNWNPGGVGGTYDDHSIGVWYNGAKWSIFNQDLADMPVDAAFNVLIPTAGTAAFVHTATAGNIISNYTLIDNPLTNNNPNAIVLVTPNWNPDGVGGTYDDHSIGVWYNGAKWSIFNQDLADMPVDAAFNVLIP